MKRKTTLITAAAATLLVGTGVALGHGMGWGPGGGYGPGAGYGPGGGPCAGGPAVGAGMMREGVAETRLATLKTALKLADAQLPVWQKFEDTVKSHAEARAKLRAGMFEQRGDPEAMASYRETMWASHREAAADMTKVRAGLYEALTPEQRAIADLYFGRPGFARR